MIMITRRNFIRGLSAAATTSLLLPKELFAFTPAKYIGIQLYTLNEQVKDDFLGTLQKIADIGYNSIEAAGYADGKFYGYAPGEYKKIATDLGLSPISSHASVDPLDAGKIIDDTLEAGHKYLVVPSIPASQRTSIDHYKKIAEQFNHIGQLCNTSGLRFGYHNHAFEFDSMEGFIPYEVLLDETRPDLVTMQIDFYWMVYGGGNPMDYFVRYPGRFGLWHVKDMDNKVDKESTEIGSGIIDWPNIFMERDMAGMEYFFLEQEHFKMDPFKSLKKSYRYLAGLKYG
jgi:sugar phosphate isomerase/epimerase